MADKIINIEDRKGWVEQGSPAWENLIMQALNELMDRVDYLEAKAGVKWDYRQNAYVEADD